MPFSKTILSGSSAGKQIIIGATMSPGTVIHTAISGSGADNMDEVYIYAANNDAVDRDLTIEWGETGGTGGSTVSVPALSGYVLVIPGFVLQDSNVVRGYSETGGKVVINGYVNRITDV